MTKPVVARIALSPIGFLHVGIGRTGIFNYLLARRNGGKFRIRIEDTEVERSDASLAKPILNALRWLGCEWDGDVIYQSHRLNFYKQYTEKLLAAGHAYRCFCTPAQLKAEKAKATAEKGPLKYDRKCYRLSDDEVQARVARGERFGVRLFIPEGETVYQDMVLGEIRRKNEDLEDFIVVRSDGSPTYDLAAVIDDHDMGVSHIIRDSDHMTDTFKQIHLYRALGWEQPEFGHTPSILRPVQQDPSKGLAEKDLLAYQKEGFLPEALFNYLCMLGWSPKTDREIYTKQELIDMFNPVYFNSSSAVFDKEKLVAFNKAHILMKSNHDLAVLVAPMLVDAGYTTKYWLETRWEYLREAIGLLKERVRLVTDFVSQGSYFFYFDYKYDSVAEATLFRPETADLLEQLTNRFAALGEFTYDATEAALNGLAEERGVEKAQLIHPARLAVSGTTAGPEFYDMLVTLSQPIAVERLKKAIDYIRAKRQF